MSETQSSNNKLSALLGFLLILSLAGNAFLASLYWQLRQETTQLRQDPQVMAQEELQTILDEVSQLITLPDGVVPILATVNNADELRERQPFFQNAQNGDKLLLYSNAPSEEDRKAYLYRPATKQLINVAPLNIGGQIQAQEDAFSIAIRNGTSQPDLAEQMESLMERIFPNSSVTETTNAANADYTQTVLVRLNGSEEVVDKVANLLNVPIANLPAGEVAPEDADMLLILGFSAEELEATASPSPSPTPTPEVGG